LIAWLAGLKRIPAILRRLRDLDRWEATLEHREKRLVAEDANARLRARIEELEAVLRTTVDLRYARNAYWNGEGYGEANGPYCAACWESNRKALRLTHLRERSYHCHTCGASVIIKERDESRRIQPPRGPGFVDNF